IASQLRRERFVILVGEDDRGRRRSDFHCAATLHSGVRRHWHGRSASDGASSRGADIVQLIGMPEGLFPLAQATIYLARAPKSNTVLRSYAAAHKDATETSREPVPLHLRNAPTPLMKHLGYGKEYRYVHQDAAAKEEMSCLPEKLKGSVYFKHEETGDGSQGPD